MATRDRSAVNDTDALPEAIAGLYEIQRRRDRARLGALTFGDWVLGTNADGDAILTYAPTGDVTILASNPT